ncbi:outer membrane usher protein, partial [Burkholderia pseudomallei 354a]
MIRHRVADVGFSRIRVTMLAAALTALSATARGQQALEFDPAFLELGGGQGGADLSVYATSNRV